jgi:hypothetical protein
VLRVQELFLLRRIRAGSLDLPSPDARKTQHSSPVDKSYYDKLHRITTYMKHFFLAVSMLSLTVCNAFAQGIPEDWVDFEAVRLGAVCEKIGVTGEIPLIACVADMRDQASVRADGAGRSRDGYARYEAALQQAVPSMPVVISDTRAFGASVGSGLSVPIYGKLLVRAGRMCEWQSYESKTVAPASGVGRADVDVDTMQGGFACNENGSPLRPDNTKPD